MNCLLAAPVCGSLFHAKAIIVLDHGKIIERGNHEDLIAQKGVYYQLYVGAFELE